MTALFLGGYLAGFIISTILFFLTKGWGEERGFCDGWRACEKGFYDGRRACEKLKAVPSVQRWIPVTQLPELDEDGESEKLLLSFSNFSLPTIGEYRVADGKGHWYDGDDDKPLEDYGLKVNAWMKLPEMYME